MRIGVFCENGDLFKCRVLVKNYIELNKETIVIDSARYIRTDKSEYKLTCSMDSARGYLADRVLIYGYLSEETRDEAYYILRHSKLKEEDRIIIL